MQAGDRVMVYDSPGFPLDHYLYADVVMPSGDGALVVIDHPGNSSHGTQRYVRPDKMMRAADARALAEKAKVELATARDVDKRKSLMDQVRHHEFVAGQLSE